MEKFIPYTINKKQLISDQDFLELGWIKKDSKGSFAKFGVYYEKGNFFVFFSDQGDNSIMTIICRDPSILEWMPYTPENFKITVKHPTLEAFEHIVAFI